MPVGKIAVVRAPLDSLVAGLEPSDVRAPFTSDGWKGYTGAGGAIFHALAISGGSLVVPFAAFDSVEEVAVAVRSMLGKALDAHTDERGLFILSGDAPPETSYDDAVATEGKFLPLVSADDPAVKKEAGWAFAAAAAAFSGAEGKKRVEERAEVDPLASAQSTLDQKLAAREDRGALRRTLSAALNHEVEHSTLGQQVEPDKGEVLTEGGDRLRKALSANPNKVTAMEGVLRAAVEGDIQVESELPPVPENVESNVIDTVGEEVK